MLRNNRWVFGGMLVALLPLMACSSHETHAEHGENPAEVEHIEGSDFSRVTLTERAMERLDVKTASVGEEGSSTVVPYSSIIYDPHGATYVYTSPEPRTFVRAPIVVDRIEGNRVLLSDGPPVGTVVASVGVAELYGTEFQVGH